MRRILLAVVAAGLCAASELPWNLKALSVPPRTYEAPGYEKEGVRALFFESVPWKGKPTRVFAFLGLPAARPGGKVPGMVLIHGGGGTAFAEWVRMWNQRGYAAIAMDTCGGAPGPQAGHSPWAVKPVRHPEGGPPGWGGFEQVMDAPEDQWPYHAVAAVVLAHSLLRAEPGVDPRRIGVTGISWGGYLTSMVSGVDPRFRFAAPVYGCGYLGEDSAWLHVFAKMGEEKARRWLGLWDPSVYLPRARLPMLWVTGTNDFAYPMNSLRKSYRLPRGPRTLAVRVRMPHNHPDGARPEEIAAFAEALLGKGARPVRITRQGREGEQAWVSYKGAAVSAELNYTRDRGPWQKRKWESAPARLDAGKRRATATIPAGVTVYYINLVDARGLVSSSEHVE